MSSVNPLNIALSGLKAAQTQIGVITNNVANVSTEGYSRKTLDQYSLVMDNAGSGVTYSNVKRQIDEILLRDYRTQISATSEKQTTLNYLTELQNFQGSPDSEQSISAYITKLKNAFASLANQPESTYMLNSTYSTAQEVAGKFNDFSAKLTDLRNNAQAEMSESVNQINTLCSQIAELNTAVKTATSSAQSTAELEDKRDMAVKSLASEMDISYYKDSSNVLVVMTRNGQLLADTSSVGVNFDATPLGSNSYYPATAAAVKTATGVDLTAVSNLGGRLGALINLRDKTLPTYQAQIDEAAHKMATRFHAEGLDLFTNPDGTIPANNPATYAGFASSIVVNPQIVSNTSLITKGTSTTSSVQAGSSEVLRKVVEFTFGNTQYQQGLGTADLSAAATPLYTTLGLTGTTRIVGSKDIQTFTTLDTSDYINPGVNDTFTLAVGTGAPQTITITAGMTPSGLITAINTAIPGMAQIGTNGQLVLNANNSITIGAGTLGANGLAELGLSAGTTAATPPSFQIAIGKNNPTTIQISPTDTGTDLLNKLNAISGVTATLTTGGFLSIVPTEGGDLSLIDGSGSPLAAMGVKVNDVAHAAFNVTNLGPAGNLDGGVRSAETIYNYVAQAVSQQAQEASNVETAYNTNDDYRGVLEKEFVNETGVNLDEEMARLITIQTAYTASARTIKVVQDMLDELIAAFIR